MNNYSEKVADYLNTFVEKSGYRLLKTEFVKEDGNFYLRAYIDLTDAEREKRRLEMEAELAAEEAEDEEAPESEELTEAEEETAEPDAEEAEEEPEEPAEPEIGVNDCAFVSRRLSKWLDKEDFIEETYTLEVCSKGYLD